MIREPHERAVALATRDSRPHAALLIDRNAAGLPMLRVAQFVHPALNLTLEKHHDATLANKPFLLAIELKSKVVYGEVEAGS